MAGSPPGPRTSGPTASGLLSPEARARIAEAVARAETGTSGEIVVMLSARAGRYRSVSAVAALAAALVVPWPLVALTPWSLVTILLVQAGLAAAILALALNERARLALVPRAIRRARARAREAAGRAFHCRGLTRTRGRTGVLLHLCLAERHAEIVADIGVLRRIGREAWGGILSDLLAALGCGETEAGLILAVGRIGERLAQACPAGPDEPDELPNGVIVAD